VDENAITNTYSAGRAEDAVIGAYGISVRDEIEQCNVSDLICDLLHLCDQKKWNKEEALTHAAGTYREER